MENKKPIKIYEKAKKIIKLYYKDTLFLIFLLFLVFYKTDYYIYKTGSCLSVNEKINADFDYEMEGNYYMNSVNVTRANIPAFLASFIIPNWDRVKESDITISNLTYEQTYKLEQIELENSIALAMINAFKKADKTVNIKTSDMTILYIDENATSSLKVMDEIISIDGKKYDNLADIKTYINTLELGTTVNFKVLRDEKETDATAKVYELENTKVVGISFITKYEYETDPKITIKTKSSEAGPSGGLMLTLAIYDTLIEEDLTNGKNIMGTGTIDENGNVGEIGGVKYKMLGAQKGNADVFFVPKDNYEEAKEVYEENDLSFELVCVETLDEAIDYLSSNK